MKTPHPAPFQYIPIGHLASVNVGMATMDGKQDWEVVEQAIDEWMRKHAPGQAGEPEFAGYQWKSLFLPHGTVLRTVFKGKSHHCRVDVDQILYQGEACSPSGFVNAVGGVRRNAWKSVWLLFPDSKHWQLADTLRARKHPVAPRRAAHTARPVKPPPAAAAPPKARSAPPPARPSPPMAHGRGTDSARMQFGLAPATHYRWSVRPASP